MWYAEIYTGNSWVRFPGGYPDKASAEWSIARWKEQWKCYGDPFRYIQES